MISIFKRTSEGFTSVEKEKVGKVEAAVKQSNKVQ